MSELDYDLSQHNSKSLDEIPRDEPFDYVITMGCGDECPFIPAKERFDWQIPDPRDMNPDDFKKVRDFIETKVKLILEVM